MAEPIRRLSCVVELISDLTADGFEPLLYLRAQGGCYFRFRGVTIEREWEARSGRLA